MNKLEKLMEKKKDGKEMDPMHKEAKMSMLKALRDEMAGMMKEDLQKPGMKKVEVASNDKEGLQAGLDKAKDILGDESEEGDDNSLKPDMGEHEGIYEHGEKESPESGEELVEDVIEHEASEDELSDDEIEQLEALLEKVKRSKMGK